MPFITQGKTNWKFLLIMVILATVLGVGVWSYQYWWAPKVTMTSDIKTCIEKYPSVDYKDCVPGKVVDGWAGILLYPNTFDASNIEHYIDAPAPDTVRQSSIARYGTSGSTCQTTWSIKINEEWKEVSQIEFCNYIIDYSSSCNDCLLEWEEGCC